MGKVLNTSFDWYMVADISGRKRENDKERIRVDVGERRRRRKKSEGGWNVGVG